jgi:hypothetical protein
VVATAMPNQANANRDRTEQVALLGGIEDCPKAVEFLTLRPVGLRKRAVHCDQALPTPAKRGIGRKVRFRTSAAILYCR